MNLTRLVDITSFVPERVEPPNSWCGHLHFAAWIVQSLNPKVFVELGTHSGNSYLAFCQAVKQFGLETKCYAVDTWQGDEHAGFYSEEIFTSLNDYHQSHYSDFSRLLRMTFDEALPLFEENSIELLHIDGLHTYEAVKHDFEAWLPKLTQGGIVIFHDTNVYKQGFGVWKFWSELKERYPNNLDFFHSYGLGVVQIDHGENLNQHDWLESCSTAKEVLRRYFSSLGNYQMQNYELEDLKKQESQLKLHITSLNQSVAARDGQIASLSHSVADRDGQIASLSHSVADRDGQIASLSHSVADRDGQIVSLSHSVVDRDGQIASLSHSVAGRDGHIADLDRAVAERDVQIKKYYQSLEDKEKEITNISLNISELNGEILRINQVLIERDNEIDILEQALSNSDGQIANYIQTTIECDRYNKNLTQTLIEREEQISNLNRLLDERNRKIQVIENSLSLRATTPLRKVFGTASPLRIMGRYVWKTITLQRPIKKWREWREINDESSPTIFETDSQESKEHVIERSNIDMESEYLPVSENEVEKPHFLPPTDDCIFVIPFDYSIKLPTNSPSVAVICHMYYPDILEEFKCYLSNIPFSFDFYITTDTEKKKIEIANGLLDWNKGNVEILLVQNRGRDIAPKLISCRDVYDRYEFFLHIHTKKSPHHVIYAGWRTYLLETLLGSEKIVESIFDAFYSDPLLGIIAPEHFDNILPSIGWGWNFFAAKKFANELGIKLFLDGKIDFPSGSMFWGRTAAIKPLLKRDLKIEEFPPENNQIDSTLGHVIERLYFFICEYAGYRWIKIGRPNLLKKMEGFLFIESKNLLYNAIKNTQYGLLTSGKNSQNKLKFKNSLESYTNKGIENWRVIHAKSDLWMIEFSRFCKELEKHILKMESLIDFDEDFYLKVFPDVAEVVAKGGLSCGYVHYCLVGKYEKRIYSDLQVKHKFAITPNYPIGFLAPIDDRPPLSNIKCFSNLPDSPRSILLILFSHLQDDLFFAGYSEFFKDFSSVFKCFDRVIIFVEHPEFDQNIALRYSDKIEVMHLAEINEFEFKPDLIIGFNAHLTYKAYQILPDDKEKVIYYCQEYESGFFPYGTDYIVCEKAIADSRNIIISTNILKKFLDHRGYFNNQQVFVTNPKIEIFHVDEAKTNRLFFYYRPESFHKRNLPGMMMQAVEDFCYKYTGYEIYMIGSVATSYSLKINGTQVYVIHKLPKNDYIELISSCDVVVSMIYAAHPGVIAFQAAASGIPTITNVFENRDATVLKQISNNIVPYDPVRDNLLSKIEEALAMPKAQPSFDAMLYSGNQQGTLVDFIKNILD